MTCAIAAIRLRGGRVTMFLTDGIMAVFDTPERAEQACRCAVEILQLTESSADCDSDQALRIGIGIHCGPALIGNVGSTLHLDYSAIGKTVNLAARLCGFAAPMTAVVSQAVMRACGSAPGLRFNAPCAINVRGVRDPVEIFQLEAMPTTANSH